MKSYTGYLYFNTKNKKEIVNITAEVDEMVKKAGVKEGIVLVSAMHITAAIFINDEEPGIKQDFLEWRKSWRLLIRNITIIKPVKQMAMLI